MHGVQQQQAGRLSLYCSLEMKISWSPYSGHYSRDLMYSSFITTMQHAHWLHSPTPGHPSFGHTF